jgi:hypothetical protein
VAGSTGATRRRTQRGRDARRRSRLLRSRLLRLGDRDAEPRRARRSRAAVHELPRDAHVLADPCRAAHRREPASRGRRHRRALRRRLPRLRDGARRRRGHRGRGLPCAGLRDPDGGQVAPREGLRLLGRGAEALLAVPARLRPLLRVPRRVHEPAPPPPARRGQPPGRDRPLSRRLLLHRRHHRPCDLDVPRAQGVEPAPAGVPVLRARFGPRARRRQASRYREVLGHLSRGMGRAAGAALAPPARARGHPPRAPAATAQRGAPARGAGVGRPLRPRAGAVRQAHGRVRGDGRQPRPERRPAPRRARRARRARQHHLRVHLRQRRVTRG